MASLRRKTQKDIGNYEPKLLGPFTSRQTVCLGIGIIPTAIAIFITRSVNPNPDPMTYLLIGTLFMAIPVFFAFGQKICYGMKPENFVADYMHYHVNSAKERLYKTKTFDDDVWKSPTEELTEQTNKKSSKSSKNTNTKEYKPKQIKGYRYFE